MILSIETTGKTASVALTSDDGLLSEFVVCNRLTHSQNLLPLIDSMLSLSNIKKSSLEYIAVSAGPGSFTGLRIGAAVAKGMAFGLNIKLIAVSTLDVLAFNVCNSENLVIPIMDARRQQLYSAIYYKGKLLSDYMVLPIEDLIDKVLSFSKSAIFLGDGVPVCKDIIQNYTKFSISPVGLDIQRAAGVATLALKLKDRAVMPKDFELFYIRESQAERARNGQKGCK